MTAPDTEDVGHTSMDDPGPRQGTKAQRLLDRFDAALARLEEAPSFSKSRHQPEVHQLASELIRSDDGMKALATRAHRFDPAGVLADGPWADPQKLVESLVAGSFRAPDPYPTLESLSELRMLAIAQGRVPDAPLSSEEATEFLERILALNLDAIVGQETEELRANKDVREGRKVAARLFHLILDELPHAEVIHKVVDEIDDVCAQRPIWTHHVRKTIRLVSRMRGAESMDSEKLRRYQRAIFGPSPLSEAEPDPSDYRRALRTVDEDTLGTEIAAFATSLRGTGLASAHHAVLLRHLARTDPDRMAEALGLDDAGRAELTANMHLAKRLVDIAIHPSTAQTAYGFARLLERNLLSMDDVAAGLRRLIDLDLDPDVKKVLLATRDSQDGVPANAVLVGGAMRVLGQPLGVGQGHNPTCQAARGISLWSQHRPGYLLETVAHAARDGNLVVPFEGDLLESKNIGGGLAPKLDPDLDPVSLVLVPHLDRLYDEMMRRVAIRPEDGHKWVNPALYGRLVPNGFAAAFEKLTGRVVGHADFVRRFYATHHPEYNGGHELIFPNPVGLVVTNTHGGLVGFHAVTVQRIGHEPASVPVATGTHESRDTPGGTDGQAPPGRKEVGRGSLRVYFYNPNNEGRQDWGQGIKVSIRGHGEREGESSLPFHEFLSRIYAFHYNPFEVGDPSAVPKKTVEKVTKLAKESWGQEYAWVEDAAPALF